MSPWKYEDLKYAYNLEERSLSKHDTDTEGIFEELLLNLKYASSRLSHSSEDWHAYLFRQCDNAQVSG